MSTNDLVRELKENIKDLQKEKADMARTIESKEGRIKQVMIKLEHATEDVHSCGHKIGEQNKRIADLEAKLDTKQRLLDEALDRIKKITDDSTLEQSDAHPNDEEVGR
jgi:peptidoglycan hydrolase CwlO-like protein